MTKYYYENIKTGEIIKQEELDKLIDKKWEELRQDRCAFESWVDENISPWQVLDWCVEEGCDYAGVEGLMRGRWTTHLYSEARYEVSQQFKKIKVFDKKI